jgi:hypothetical protein
MSENHKKCLVLNTDYTPVRVISWKQALKIYFKYQHSKTFSVEIIDFYKDDHIVGTGSKKYPVPAVVKISKYRNVRQEDVKFSRKNVFLRDNHTCQYCGCKYEAKDLTKDHVIPRSKWNKKSSSTIWTNIATACKPCNLKKGNKTLQQSGMKILKEPVIPDKSKKYLRIYEYLDTIKENIPEEWKYYV